MYWCEPPLFFQGSPEVPEERRFRQFVGLLSPFISKEASLMYRSDLAFIYGEEGRILSVLSGFAAIPANIRQTILESRDWKRHAKGGNRHFMTGVQECNRRATVRVGCSCVRHPD